MSWTRFLWYSMGGIGGLIFAYYFHQAKYSIHETEIMLLDRFRRLPLYWPPSLRPAEKNSALCGEGLQPDLVVAFAEWFVVTDLREAGGVVRDDILELFKEIGLSEDHPAAKAFIQRGDGQLEEHRRLSGAGLQESIKLLAAMSLSADGVALGEEAVEILRKKVRRASSVMDGAAALRQAMQAPQSSPGSLGTPSPASPAVAVATAPAAAWTAAPPDAASFAAPASASALEAEDSEVDEDQMRKFEDARLQRIEKDLMDKLHRMGSLSLAEEARLKDVRERRSRS